MASSCVLLCRMRSSLTPAAIILATMDPLIWEKIESWPRRGCVTCAQKESGKSRRLLLKQASGIDADQAQLATYCCECECSCPSLVGQINEGAEARHTRHERLPCHGIVLTTPTVSVMSLLKRIGTPDRCILTTDASSSSRVQSVKQHFALFQSLVTLDVRSLQLFQSDRLFRSL
jgi:hypothetical protein